MDKIRNSTSDATTASVLAEEGREVRGFVASNRSDTLLRLFDVLLQQSVAGRRPTETEIAEEIFGHDVARSGGQGSRARVGVYRLRKKLDLYYTDKPGPRLVIPPGEYGFIVSAPDAASDGNVQAESTSKGAGLSRGMWGAASAILLANIALGWFYFGHDIDLARAPDRPELWQSFDAPRRPTIITIGDYFMFASEQNDAGTEQIIQDLSIDSPDAFYEYVTSTPAVRDSVRNDDLYAVSSDLLGPIGDLWAYLRGDRGLQCSPNV